MAINYHQVIRVPPEGLADPEKKTAEIPDTYELKSRIRQILIPESIIKKRVKALAGQISREFRGATPICMIPVLKGAFVFAADLGREIIRQGGSELKIDFYETETYGIEIKKENEGMRRVKILRRPRATSVGPVIFIDDVADTLQTLDAVLTDTREHLGIDRSRIRLCFLLDKLLKNPPDEIGELRERLKPDYVGFEVPDVWVAGYGIDAGEDFRFLNCVVSIDEDYYSRTHKGRS